MARRYVQWLYIIVCIVIIYIGYLRVLEGFQDSPHYYTIRSQFHDGFGSQYHGIMSGIAYAKSKGFIYVHSPFVDMQHKHHGVDVNKMNEFIGIKTTPMAEEVSNVEVAPSSEEVHYSDKPSKYYTKEVIQTIKDFYYSTEKPRIENNDIAIHVRRGDVSHEINSSSDRYTSNEDYNKILLMLRREYPTYNITVHSQGNLEDFSDLVGDNITYKLNEDLRQTFHSLVTAKVLVMAKSSLSYSAAILNEGTVYYQDFWHKPLDGWKNVLRE
jgi:hypothetical protein